MFRKSEPRKFLMLFKPAIISWKFFRTDGMSPRSSSTAVTRRLASFLSGAVLAKYRLAIP